MSRIDLELVKDAASSRWPEMITQLANVDQSILDGKHHPCPKCDGTDRFRFFTDGTGGAICNQCFTSRNGDGLATLQWLTGQDFKTILQSVAEYLGIKPTAKARKSDPEEHIEWKEWNDTLATLWCIKKPPVSPDMLKQFGARLGTYRKSFAIVAIPIWGKDLDKSDPVGWIMYPQNGRTLPRYAKDGPTEWVKVKIAAGSGAGLVAPVERLKSAKVVWKLEGPTDAIAANQVLPVGHVAITNSNGAKEKPKAWILDLFQGKQSYVLHDADVPGQEGATWVGESDGRKRPGWAPSIAKVAGECRNVELPYPVTQDHGRDFRDFLAEGNAWRELELLAEKAQVVKVDQPGEAFAADLIEESDDDPHRLARMNLYRYSTSHGGTLKYWRDEWYVWKKDRYRKIMINELKAKLNMSIKMEFDRLYRVQAQQSKGDEAIRARKVTQTLVNNVLAATQSMVVLPSSVELGTWVDEDQRTKRSYLALTNGVLDIDALMDHRPDYMLEHSPKWFSTICLPYSFDPNAKCPKWKEFLVRNLEGDRERMDLLQEWAGLMLLPDTSYQKFLVLEGEGANGKSVYCAAIEAMLGSQNVSHVPMEIFGDRFSRTQTLDKLMNVSADVGEIDKLCEGYLKSYTSGEMMYFDRKGISGIDAYPTARLVMACNNRPRFSDKSDGIWRRMILVPMRVQIPRSERVANMDKAWWWEQSGELPGILCWALRGLFRLRDQGGFTRAGVCEEAIEDYKAEANPAREFLLSYYEESEGSRVETKDLYSAYKKWAHDGGYRPLSAGHFGKEVFRVFKQSKKVRGQWTSGSRYYAYEGIREGQSDLDAEWQE